MNIAVPVDPLHWQISLTPRPLFALRQMSCTPRAAVNHTACNASPSPNSPRAICEHRPQQQAAASRHQSRSSICQHPRSRELCVSVEFHRSFYPPRPRVFGEAFWKTRCIKFCSR
ncbi:fruitless transcript variant P2-1-B [Striga asiatica]|uniref:Fruitless transcript variant P2-1-B n=1 Tax=Striga asiatica TaxID=4170 RepID=A0A5A7Q8H1_STRAF|nr:fruitless transcript variant P2-1-B [Striga asiatica]